MSSKDLIIERALELFSIRGYGAVSIRDIAGAVGIRESSIYYHFKSKRDIFDTIVETCFSRAREYFQKHELPFEIGDDISIFDERNLDVLTERLLTVFRYFFEDAWNVRFRQLLTVSQFEDARARDVYRSLYREYPIEYQSRIFQRLMDQGTFRQENPRTVAVAFYSTVFMLLHTCDDFESAEPALRAHIRQFVQSYQIDER